MIVITNKGHAQSPIRSSLTEAGCTLFDYSEVDQVNKLEIDRVIIFSGMGDYDRSIVTKTANSLRDDITVGWWLGDLRKPEEHLHRHSLQNVDYMFVPSLNWIDKYREYVSNVHHIPQSGYSYNTDKYKYSRCDELDCIFIGNPASTPAGCWHDNRRTLLSEFHKCSRMGVIHGEMDTRAQSYIYNNVPISISITWPDSICYSSNRLYNILAAGGVAFQNYIPGLEKMFVNHEHLVWYKHQKALPELVDHYLKNTNLIENIRINAKKLYQDKHTGTCRVNDINNIMSGKTASYSHYVK